MKFARKTTDDSYKWPVADNVTDIDECPSEKAVSNFFYFRFMTESQDFYFYYFVQQAS